MSTAAPRSCLKHPPRNPWVAEDGGESSTSSGQQQQQANNHFQYQQQQQQQQQQQGEGGRAGQDVLAHQYATPYHALPTPHSLSSSHSVTGHPAVSVSRAGHSTHGVVHSHTAHSLHAHAHSHAHQRPLPNAAHSVHSVPGSLQQPWIDQQLLWGTSALPGVGVSGVYTVGGVGTGGTDGSCPVLPPGVYGQSHSLHPIHHLPQGGGSSGQTSTTGGAWNHPPAVPPPPHSSGVGVGGGVGGTIGGWGTVGGVRVGSGGLEGSRCERCHYYCFKAAQAAFVVGIVTGFSLLVAGGVFHRQHVAHLQVLVYIGALVSLVCVVLLVIFCAMNKDPRARRAVPLRFSGPQVVVGDPEAVPLRPMEANNPVVLPSEASHGARTAESGSSMDMLHQSNHSSCMVGPPPPPTSHGCYYGGAPPTLVTSNHNSLVNHGPINPTDATHQRNAQQRVEEDYEASHRYNRIWKQPVKPSNEASSKL